MFYEYSSYIILHKSAFNILIIIWIAGLTDGFISIAQTPSVLFFSLHLPVEPMSISGFKQN